MERIRSIFQYLHPKRSVFWSSDRIGSKNSVKVAKAPHEEAQSVAYLCAQWIVRNRRRRQLYPQELFFPTFSDPPVWFAFTFASAIASDIVIALANPSNPRQVFAKPLLSLRQALAKPSQSPRRAFVKPSPNYSHAAFETKTLLPPEDDAECPHQLPTIPLSNT